MAAVRSKIPASEAVGDAAPATTEAFYQDLLRRVTSGDQAAFTTLYEQLFSRVLGVVRGVVVDQAQAEEVAQDVFLDIWVSAKRYRPDRGSVLGWVLMISRAKAIDRVRACQASRDRDVRIGFRDHPFSPNDFTETISTRYDYETLHALIQKLTPKQKTALTLYYLHDMTGTQLARHLGVPLPAAKSRVHEALHQLRTALT